MKDKRDFFKLLVCMVSFLLIFPIWIVLTDPFHQYHAPWFGFPVVLEDVVYQTPGTAKNLEYDSAIVGTSMTENCRVSWFDELGWDTMKLCYSGATCNDLNAILNSVYAGDRQVDHIYMDLNDYQLSSPADVTYVDRPEYLYTETVLDDISYLFNHDAFVMGVERLRMKLQGQLGNIETAHTWEDAELFGKQRVLDGTRGTKEALLKEREDRLALEDNSDNHIVSEKELEEIKKVCQDNLDNILPFIEGHPETEYFIFFPPYSMLYWEQVAIEDKIETTIEMYTYAIEQLLPYENVKIYYFQGEEFVDDLDEYRDATHHKPEINRYVFECVRDDKKRLTEENYKEEIDKVYQRVKDYDYEALWE